MDISRWIERHAAFHGGKIAVRTGDRTLSYAALHGEVLALARGLAAAGHSRGDRIAWWGLNSSTMIALLFAAARLGLILVPVNWRLADDEIRFVLDHASVRTLFVETLFKAQAERICLDPQAIRIVVADGQSGGTASLAEFAHPYGRDADPEVTLEMPILLGFTSGTTGRPKGAILTQGALFWNAVNAQHMHDMTAADHVLTVLPMFHVGGLCIQTLPALHLGGTVSLLPRFTPQATLDAIQRDRPTLTVLVPATMAALVADPLFAGTDFSSLRAIATGSTDVPVAQIEQLHSRGVPVIQVYGATETGPLAIYQKIADSPSVGSIGKPALHCEIRLVAADGRDCAVDEAGEILVRGPNVTTGYWRDEEATEAALRDGWFQTGDVAIRDAQGTFWFRDRIKNVIISGGENVYPAELERVLATCPAILECAVVGRTDPKWGQTPVAIVVPAEGARLTQADVLGLFDGRLARFKHPREVRFLDRLPRNAMGKVETGELKRLLGTD
jgi:fatty-acyl-CoA synthase